MDTISPEIAAKLLNRDFANMIQRVQKGGTLSQAERAKLECLAAKAGDVSAFAADYTELARILGVNRRTILRWREFKDAPQPGPSGFHEVALWREFMKRHGLKGEPATEEEDRLRKRKLRAEVEERELRLANRRRDYVSFAEVRAVWNRNATKAAGLIRQKFLVELPPILAGLDAVAIQQEFQKAIDEVLTVMSSGDGAVKAA